MNVSCRLSLTRKKFSLKCDIVFPESQITVLTGNSGGGKTTLLRCLAGLEKECVGDITVFGREWQSKNSRVATHERKIGYVFQEASLFPHLTVLQNIEYGFQRLPQLERVISVDDVITLLEIDHLKNRKTENLSGGERQRVAMARALAVNPQLLLLDEPFAALDEATRFEMTNRLRELVAKSKITTIYVTHARAELRLLAENIIHLEKGKVLFQGKRSEYLSWKKMHRNL